MSGDRLPDVPLALNAVPLLTPLTGVGHYTHQLARHLGALWPQSPNYFYGTFWSRELRTPPAREQPSLALRARRAVPFGYGISRALQQIQFSRGAKRSGIAVYHEPNYLAFRFAGPTVVTVHDLSWIRHPEAHPAERVATMNAAMPRVMRDAARIIADSEFTRREIIEHYAVPAERVTTVLLGVLDEFHPRAPEECGAVLDARGLQFGGYLLAVGTLEPRKNLATTVAAFASLPKALRQRFPLVIAGAGGWGEGILHPALGRMVAEGEAHMPGYIPQAELPVLYAGARAFVYPSLYEGFGLPPLEAMASGVPVVVSNRASLPEVVGTAGLVVDALDDEALADAMRRLLEDEALHGTHASAGRSRAADFTWLKCAQRTAGVYDAALRA